MDWVAVKNQHPQQWFEFQSRVSKVLDAAIEVVHAVRGNVQLFNPRVQALQIIAHRGFNNEFLQLFDNVHIDEPSACGRAFRFKHRVAIFDISTDAQFAPYLSVARANGFRSVQSTPIFAMDGSPTGMLSTHYAEIHQLSESEELVLDNQAAYLSRMLSDLLEIEVERLRSHPAIIASWPPIWSHTSGDKRKTMRGEVGFLSRVYTMSQNTQACYLVIEHEADTYIGALILKNAALCSQVCSLLEQHVGRSIAEIGSLGFCVQP